MNLRRWVFALAAGGLLLPGAGFQAQAAGTPAESFTVRLEAPRPEFTRLPGGEDAVGLPGFAAASAPGEPALPGKTVALALPPGVDLASVRVSLADAQVRPLEGTYRLPAGPAPCPLDGAACPTTASRSPWPALPGPAAPWVESMSFTSSGDLHFLRLWFSPLEYDPGPGSLRLAEAVTLRVSYRLLAGESLGQPGPASAGVQGQELLRQAANPAQAAAWYPALLAGGGQEARPGYAILTTEAILQESQGLPAFVAHQQARGFRVLVVTESEYGGLAGQAPNGAAEKIRRWLQDHAAAESLRYVLLVGDPDPDDPGDPTDTAGAVPMKMTWPRRGAYSDEEAVTDAYYADLTGDWDLDGDGYFGEYRDDFGPGGVDLTAEVYVGRIPVYPRRPNWAAALDQVLAKTIAYHNAADRSWRRSALLPMSFSDSLTSGAPLAEALIANSLGPAGFSAYTLYQHRGPGCQAPFPSSQDLAGGAVGQYWRSHPFGLATYWGHGTEVAAYVGYGTGCSDGSLLAIQDTQFLDDAHPAMVFGAACRNGYPETDNNLGYALLKRGAVVVFSATRTAWYIPGAWSPVRHYADSATLAYYITGRLAAGEPAGQALYAELGLSGPGWGPETWMNLMVYNLYGDPSTSLLGDSPSAATPAPAPVYLPIIRR